MKISWGVGIAITIIVFTIVSILFIVFAFSQDVNLVTDDYYAKELAYQDQIDKEKRTQELPEQLKISVDNNYIFLQFPKIFSGKNIEGSVQLYRPASRHNDAVYTIAVNDSNLFVIPTDSLIEGMWRVKVDWAVDSTTYYNEKIIMVR